MIKGNLFAGELCKTACLKGGYAFVCLTCFSHNLKRPTLAANSAHGDGPHSSCLGTIRLRRDDRGENPLCQGGAGGEKKKSFSYSATNFVFPRRLDPLPSPHTAGSSTPPCAVFRQTAGKRVQPGRFYVPVYLGGCQSLAASLFLPSSKERFSMAQK